MLSAEALRGLKIAANAEQLAMGDPPPELELAENAPVFYTLADSSRSFSERAGSDDGQCDDLDGSVLGGSEAGNAVNERLRRLLSGPESTTEVCPLSLAKLGTSSLDPVIIKIGSRSESCHASRWLTPNIRYSRY